MQPFVPVEALVKGSAFRRTDHHPVCQLVHELQIESERLGNHDGGSRHCADAYDDSALGPARVDFFLSRNRDVNAAKTFLRSSMKNTRKPTKITLDAYAASHQAVREMKETGELSKRVRVRSSEYLNNLIE